jgi:pimeloyl-ACP methyl ester carboxylesterase
MRRAGLLGALLILVACGGATADPETTTTAAHSTTAPPTPPTSTTAAPGGLIVAAEALPSPEGITAWTIEYRSQTVLGEPTTVTGWVAIPDDAEPGAPVVAWAHPTLGLGDDCAPSLQTAGPFAYQRHLDAGRVVVATDYEGLGGPGVHPYLLSESEARSIFDIVRAAQELDARTGTDLIVWGFSQGGHAALSAAGMAAELAPDLNVRGVVAVAPAVDLIGWPPVAIGTAEQGYIAAIVAGWSDALGLDPAEVIAADALPLLEEVRERCADPLTFEIASRNDAFVVDPSTVQPWAALLEENSPELRHIDAPVLLVVGGDDHLFVAELLPLVVTSMCEVDTPLTTNLYPGETHQSVNAAADADIQAFIDARFAGEEFESEC